jgi:hypothetical protein
VPVRRVASPWCTQVLEVHAVSYPYYMQMFEPLNEEEATLLLSRAANVALSDEVEVG